MRNLLLLFILFICQKTFAYEHKIETNVSSIGPFFAYAYGTNPTCPNFNNGKVDVIVFGATGPITYLWSNGATTDSLRNLTQGTYSVIITDATGYSYVETVTLTNISGIYPSVNINRQPSCPNFNNGEVSTYNVFGGSPPYSYRWSNGATTDVISNLSAGTYGLTVTDANGCVGETDVVLLDGSGFATISPVQYASCPNFNNGILEVDAVFNLTPPLTYLWSNGATTQRANNLTEGTYDVTVTDVNGCTGTQSGYIYNVDIYAFINTIQSPTCPNYNNGSLDVDVIFGGIAPLTYKWSNGATTKAISNLSEGDYSVTITDANGCSTELTQSLVKNYPYVYIQTTQPPTCPTFNNGVLEFAGFLGGVPPFTYLWNSGATTSAINNVSQGNYTLSVTDANGCSATQTAIVTNSTIDVYVYPIEYPTCPSYNNGIVSVAHISNGVPPFSYLWSNGATTSTINNLTEGNYELTVTDANGCTGVSSVFLQKSVSFYAYLDINQNVSCVSGGNNGEVEVKGIFGGNAPYTYLWNNGATTSIISNLSVGTYTVTITDATGCKADFSISLFNQGLYPATAVTQQPTCPNFDNGSAEVVWVYNGTAPYNYLWSTGATTVSVGNLSNGIYSVTVTDANGCSGVESVYVFGTLPIVYAYPTQLPTCPNFNNGEVEIAFVHNATPPYTYQWSNGATTATVGNLTAGTYVFTLTDANGCSSEDSVYLENGSLYPVIAGSDPTCPSNKDGFVNVLYTLGGTAPYTYVWSTGATTNTVNNLGLGDYYVTVTDANGCTGVGAVGLYNTAIWTQTYVIQQPSCSNSNDGSAGVYVVGHAPFTYIWSTGATTDTIGGLAPGTYFVTVTDFKGCSIVDSITLNSMYSSSRVVNFSFVTQGNTVHFHSTNTYARQMSWAFGDGNSMNNLYHTPSHTYIQAGRYNVTLTCQDSCGTIASRTVTIDIGNFVTLDAKVYLQANYDPTTGKMDDFMRSSDLLPTNEPYSTIFNHISNVNENTTKAILSQSTFPTVVDWIFVELRDANNPASIVATRAALLLQNGKIVDTDGASPLRFSAVSSNNYFIAIRHRNHLGFRTLNPIALNQNGVSIDFTNNSTQLFGMTPMTTMNGSFVMISGDANSDGSIDAFDTILWENQNGTFDNYDNADYNLDGSVDAFDSIIWELNNGKFEELD